MLRSAELVTLGIWTHLLIINRFVIQWCLQLTRRRYAPSITSLAERNRRGEEDSPIMPPRKVGHL